MASRKGFFSPYIEQYGNQGGPFLNFALLAPLWRHKKKKRRIFIASLKTKDVSPIKHGLTTTTIKKKRKRERKTKKKKRTCLAVV